MTFDAKGLSTSQGHTVRKPSPAGVTAVTFSATALKLSGTVTERPSALVTARLATVTTKGEDAVTKPREPPVPSRVSTSRLGVAPT